MENETGELDPLNPTEELELEIPEEVEPQIPEEDLTEKLQATEEKLKKAEETAFNQKIRAEKAEAKIKSSAPKQTAGGSDVLTREEAILYAKGLSAEQVEYAKKVASLEGITAVEATSNHLYTSWVEKTAKDKQDEDAQLRTSTGSRPRKKIDFDTEKLSDEDHRKLFDAYNKQ